MAAYTVEEVVIEVKDTEGLWVARIHRDGCIDFVQHQSGPGGPSSAHLHICDIDQMIELLQSLKAAAVLRFGEWPGEGGAR